MLKIKMNRFAKKSLSEIKKKGKEKIDFFYLKDTNNRSQTVWGLNYTDTAPTLSFTFLR